MSTSQGQACVLHLGVDAVRHVSRQLSEMCSNQTLIVDGQSQSAGRLGSYSQAIHNVTTAPVYDAFPLNYLPRK